MHIKRLIAILLVVTLTLSLGTTAIAVSSEAAACETIGMIKGTGEGVTPEYLATTAARYQAAVLYLRLKGLEEEMLNFDYEGEATFNDAQGTSAYIQRLLAYLKANPELGWQGYTDGSFKPFNKITNKEYFKVMLEALGYEQDADFTWDQVYVFASLKGIEAINNNKFTVDNLCVATVRALEATTKEGAKLVDDLIDAGVIRTVDAVLVGLVNEPDQLTVDSIVMDSLGEVRVIFNMEVDEEDIAITDFRVSVDNVVKSITGIEVDGAEIYIALPKGAIDQQDDVTVLIKKEIGMVSDIEKTIENVLDIKIPKVLSVNTNGPNELLVRFSEPLNIPPVVKINNNAISSRVTGFVVGDKEVRILADSTLGDGMEYAIEISGAKDYSDLIMNEYIGSFVYTSAKTPVVATILSVSETEVKIKFSEEVTGVTKDNFWHTFSSYVADEVLPDSSGGKYYDEYTVRFNNHFIGYSDTTFMILGENIEDRWGNGMAGNVSVTVKSVKDITSPTVSIVEFEGTQVIVQFSESVKSFNVSNVALYDSDTNRMTVTAVNDSSLDDNQYRIKYNQLIPGEYSLIISDVYDYSFKENVLNPNPTILTFELGDTVAPDLSGVMAEITDQTAYIKFPEPMSNSVIDTDMWRGVIGISQYEPETAEFLGTSRTEIKLTFTNDVTPSSFSKLIVGQVEDTSGNKLSALSTELTVITASHAQILEVKTLSENQLTIKVDGRIIEGDIASNVSIVGSDGVTSCLAASISKAIVDDNTNTLLTVKTQANVKFTASEIPEAVQLSNMKVDRGVDVTHNKYYDSDGIMDGIAPQYVSSTTSGSIVLLRYDENLKSSVASSMAHSLIVKVDGVELQSAIDYFTTIGGTHTPSTHEYIEISFNTDISGKMVIIETTNTPTFIQDTSGNISKPIEATLEFQF